MTQKKQEQNKYSQLSEAEISEYFEELFCIVTDKPILSESAQISGRVRMSDEALAFFQYHIHRIAKDRNWIAKAEKPTRLLIRNKILSELIFRYMTEQKLNQSKAIDKVIEYHLSTSGEPKLDDESLKKIYSANEKKILNPRHGDEAKLRTMSLSSLEFLLSRFIN